MKHLFIIFPVIILLKYVDGKHNGSFPDNFIFGVATAAYQIEGAWNEGGKTESIWDHFTHQNPSPIVDGDTGDIACDSYHKYKEDVALAAKLGISHYRFSVSWPRILPTGYPDKINLEGVQFYRNLISEILKYNMIPVATIYHWDLPQSIAYIGWDNPDMIDIFVNFARVVIKHFPEVGLWLTINEPRIMCHYGYGDVFIAPGKNSSALAEYQCGYIALKAHAKTYHMYKNEFPNYTAKMALSVDCGWYEPLTNSSEDIEAAQRLRSFECGMFVQPVFVGDWPKEVKDRIRDRSLKENLPESRLPEFTTEEINYIKGTSDLLSLNHYFSYLVEDIPEIDNTTTSFQHDVRLKLSEYPNARLSSNKFPIVPVGLTKLLKYIKDNFNDPEIIITELGVADEGSLEDDSRIDFYVNFFDAILDAKYDHDVKVTGILLWSLLDNFQWYSGYSTPMGLYHVNFTDPNRARTAKKSVDFVKKVVKTKRIPTGLIKSNNIYTKPIKKPDNQQHLVDELFML